MYLIYCSDWIYAAEDEETANYYFREYNAGLMTYLENVEAALEICDEVV